MMNKLIAKGVKYTDNAVLMAAQGGRQGANGLPVFQYLEGLKLKPAAINANGETALFYVVRRPKQEELINYFISRGVDVNDQDKEGNTAFMNAAGSNSDLSTLNMLVKQLKNINQTNAKGYSALTLSVRNNTAEVVKWLLDQGASVNITDKNGDNLITHLLQSYTPRNAEAFDAKLKLLTDKGLSAAAMPQNGSSWYHIAVAKNDLNLINRAKSLPIDINQKNKEGYTALHKAALIARNTEILKQLIELGAKKDITTGFKETAYDLARENDYLIKQNVNLDFLKP